MDKLSFLVNNDPFENAWLVVSKKRTSGLQMEDLKKEALRPHIENKRPKLHVLIFLEL